tara:strand:+ start:68983 stop:69192 length:210 start_codon:yes stop_codon:yes gene_type:complete
MPLMRCVFKNNNRFVSERSWFRFKLRIIPYKKNKESKSVDAILAPCIFQKDLQTEIDGTILLFPLTRLM